MSNSLDQNLNDHCVLYLFISKKKKEMTRPVSTSTWYLSIMGHYEGTQSSPW